MSWREAFFAQAKSDASVRRLLNKQQAAYCHQLHYLQMMTEKWSRAVLMRSSRIEPPPHTHVRFVRCLQTLKGSRQIREQLGYDRADVFNRMIDSLLPLARQIEQLAPSEAGDYQANPEYPWQALSDQEVYVPAEYAFSEFDPKSTQMVKLIRLLENLMKLQI